MRSRLVEVLWTWKFWEAIETTGVGFQVPYRSVYLSIYLSIIGYLSACCQQDLYDVLLTQVLKRLTDEQKSMTSLANVRTFLQCVGAIG